MMVNKENFNCTYLHLSDVTQLDSFSKSFNLRMHEFFIIFQDMIHTQLQTSQIKYNYIFKFLYPPVCSVGIMIHIKKHFYLFTSQIHENFETNPISLTRFIQTGQSCITTQFTASNTVLGR